MNRPRIPQQVISLAFLFVILIAVFVGARILFVPQSFGEYGHYRSEAVDEIVVQKLNYAGYHACIDCHDDIYNLKMESNHRGVACEVCHGPAAEHVEAPDEFTPDAPRKRGFCPLCHGYDLSRPTGFPQIIPMMHNPGKVCISCHDPHNPLLPHKPEDCSACHREIASQKMVSHHAVLPCLECHTVPEQHLTDPRFVKAEKPMKRELCGKCHAEGAQSPEEIPRIDMDTHEHRYLCWDCHYPHHPEANN